MKLKLAHYRNRFSMFRTYYALRAGLVKTDGLEFAVIEVPDPPSRELEESLIRGDVDVAVEFCAALDGLLPTGSWWQSLAPG